MRPRFTPFDLSDVALLNSIVGSYHLVQSRVLAYVAYVFSGKLCAARSLAVGISTLANHILRVLFVGANKQVEGVDASSIIAGMANYHPFGNFGYKRLVGDSVRPAIGAVVPDLGISPFIKGSTPDEASVFVRNRHSDDFLGNRELANLKWAIIESMHNYLPFLSDCVRGRCSRTASRIIPRGAYA